MLCLAYRLFKDSERSSIVSLNRVGSGPAKLRHSD